LRGDHEEIALRQIELGVVAATEPPRGRDDLIEDGLQAFGTRDRSKNLADRAPLLAQVLVVPSEFLNVEWFACVHGADCTTNQRARRR
jgi:hypothetical protein